MDLCLVFTSFILLIALHQLLTFRYTVENQNSWIITTIASAIMTLCSLPFLWDFVLESLNSQFSWQMAGEGVKGVRARSMLAFVANRFFQSYLLADLTAGIFYYRGRINLLTGWMHHIAYVGIVEFAIRQRRPHIFCLAAFMELPTFILGVFILAPKTRSNVLFAVVFFLTRILFNIVLVISYALPDVRKHATGDSFAVSGILLGALPLHIIWFVGCIKGFARRAKEAKDARLSERRINTVEVNLKVYNATDEKRSPTPSSTRKALAAIHHPVVVPPGHVHPHPATDAAQHYYHRLCSRFDRWRIVHGDVHRHGQQNGAHEGDMAQLYTLRGGSLSDYRARIREYRRNVARKYREYAGAGAVSRESREKMFDWVGLGTSRGPKSSRRATC
ncbi:hypothetical protein E1B28_005806 [Marasmius oreades]|uniref:TLC domain-containing protein n=1 Tax=Marasmius oreades TaxID=181124 RepID=A0A9P7UVW8_9AGAR|nr:uncharacterized protein E1B28_005806 [Marasmius oreades]KAG7095011.1 hypothetical protein E1B28_005806 [Marasmius oreades]